MQFLDGLICLSAGTGPAEAHAQGPPGLPSAAGRAADLSELPLLHQRGD